MLGTNPHFRSHSKQRENAWLGEATHRNDTLSKPGFQISGKQLVVGFATVATTLILFIGCCTSVSYSPPSHRQLPAVSPRLHEGVTVTVTGLQKAKEYNGKHGTVVQWLNKKKRWEVQLEGGEVHALKRDNLVTVPSTPTVTGTVPSIPSLADISSKITENCEACGNTRKISCDKKDCTKGSSTGRMGGYHMHSCTRPCTWCGKPCVEVARAGNAQVNGWYVRKEAAEGPPGAWDLHSKEGWSQKNGDRPWYEKDDGCFIYRHTGFGGGWRILTPAGNYPYYCEVSTRQAVMASVTPPAQGWLATWDRYNPVPTLLVVNH